MGRHQGARQPAQARRIVRAGGNSFGDPFACTFNDPDHSMREARFITIGQSVDHLLVVMAHAERGRAIRIISARKATRHERSIYEQD
jgi:uncharacterized DUF497 family protein